MPNPLGRRRVDPAASSEVTKLKAELDELKSMYLRDVTLISQDIHSLNTQISASGVG